MPNISGFIIAKNEEETIGIALKSLVSFCDEIVVVDTGSTDRTKMVAAQFTKHIFDFEWNDDFSAARNFALDRCHGDWIFYLDADDEILAGDQTKIKNVLLTADQHMIGFYFNYAYHQNKNLLVSRLFRNRKDLRFAMPIHEYLDIPEQLRSKFKVFSDITVFHRKDPSKSGLSIERKSSYFAKSSS